MGLSAELLQYAENVWRRFPEVFVSLGSPYFEEYFELYEDGSWHQRVIDTDTEKIIEIRLPRRIFHSEEEVSCDDTLQDGDGVGDEDNLLYEIDEMRSRVMDLDSWVGGQVKTEVQSQMHRADVNVARPERRSSSKSSSLNSVHSEGQGPFERSRPAPVPPPTAAALSVYQPFPARQLSQHSQEVAERAAAPPQPPLKPDLSRLASRRGNQYASLHRVVTNGLGKVGSGSVKRVPELDRIAGFPVQCYSLDSLGSVGLLSRQVTPQMDEESQGSQAQQMATANRHYSSVAGPPPDRLPHSMTVRRAGQAPPLASTAVDASLEFQPFGFGVSDHDHAEGAPARHRQVEQRNVAHRQQVYNQYLYPVAWPTPSGAEDAPSDERFSEGSPRGSINTTLSSSPEGSMRAADRADGSGSNDDLDEFLLPPASRAEVHADPRVRSAGHVEPGSPVRQRRAMPDSRHLPAALDLDIGF